MKHQLTRIVPYALPLLVLAVYVILLLHGTNLTGADLGRHIENGRLFFENWSPIATNTYSYTHPDFPAANHHWLSGVLFYLAFILGGFKSTHLLFLAVSLGALWFFFRVAQRRAGIILTTITTLTLLPLIANRGEIRPEAFSYLLAGIFLWLLVKHRAGEITGKKLIISLALLHVLWVNLHIYFFVGFIVVGTFLLEAMVENGLKSKRARELAIAFGALIAASLVNPFFIAGAITPLTIFNEYGYRLAENQSVWFMEKILPKSTYTIFKISFAALIVSFIPAFIKKRRDISLADVIFALGFSLAGWFAIRNFTIFALFALPILAAHLALIIPHTLLISRKARYGSIAILLAGTIIFTIGRANIPTIPPLALGMVPGNLASATFFTKNNLKGPVFNNYDIGGYLIQYLYPKEKVYVDNRPEAYPTSFFEEVYIPMQQDDTVWKEQVERYNFNAIFFAHRDYTPWGQQFLITRIDDPDWAPVFVDATAIIFLRRNEENAQLIDKFEIPREAFRVTRT